MNKLRILLLACFMLALVCPALAQNKADTISHQEIIKTVSQSRGKVVVVNFWASWCGPCRQEIPDLIAMRNKLPASKVVILGVSLDQDPGLYAAFVAGAKFNYPVYMAKPDVGQAFMIRAIPRTVIYGPHGEQAVSREGFMSGEELERIVNKLMGA